MTHLFECPMCGPGLVVLQKENLVTVPYNQRTHTCGQLRLADAGGRVALVGWVNSYRDHGGMVFIDLRDHDGLTQIKFNPQTDPNAHQIARTLRSEDCVAIAGDVAPRGENINPKLATGEIEVNGREIDILNKSETPIFEIADHIEAGEDIRLRYRFLDLRRGPLQRAMRTRHRITKAIRDYFDGQGFLEIETPFLTKSTPEGARDYLVPSRIQPGCFYALPQSPQLFKQLFMIGGMDRYMQIVRCFRDEDLRADRQPEFTQVDVEMAFVREENVIAVTEGAIAHVMREVMGIEIPLPMPRMTYAEAMRDYGTDRPDTRYSMKLIDITGIARKTEFNVFTAAVQAGGVVRCLVCPGGGEMTRKETDGLSEEIKGIGAGGMPVTKVVAGEGGKPSLQTGIAKFLAGPLADELIAATGAKVGDAIFFAADSEANVCKYLAWARAVLAQRRKMIPHGQFNFCWVVDFPLLEYSPEDKRWYSMHHPFTSPHDEDWDKLESDPGSIRAKAYDVVLNGVELGGGSIRIHRTDLQQRVFRVLGIGEEEAHAKFEHLLTALKYGAPPHGGIALGLDRFVMLLLGLDSIRDVVAFPKTQRAVCPLTNAPSEVDPTQLAELGIDLTPATKAKLTGTGRLGGPEHVHKHDKQS
jgi:aspartyl-tRNA synthetase